MQVTLFKRCKSGVVNEGNCPNDDSCPLNRFLVDARAHETNLENLKAFFYDSAHGDNAVTLTTGGVEVVCSGRYVPGPVERGILRITESRVTRERE